MQGDPVLFQERRHVLGQILLDKASQISSGQLQAALRCSALDRGRRDHRPTRASSLKADELCCVDTSWNFALEPQEF
jgi:hypothetical protein